MAGGGAAAAAYDWNHGVPGDWITGNRMLDVAALPLVFAAAFPLLRLALKRWVFQPRGVAVFEALAKRRDAAITPEQLDAKLVKWNESCWKLTVYVIFSAAALAVAAGEPWLFDPRRYWDGATKFPLNYYVPLKVGLFYLLEIGFYLQAIPFLMFVEVRRKDWAESFAHHVITLGLMYYSWYTNFTRAGVIVMLLHDPSDIFLEAAKLARYAQRDAAATAWFAGFAGSWVVLRCVLFPYVAVCRMLVDPVVYVAIPYDIDPQPHYSVFGTLFMLLFFLHAYWTYLIFRVIARQLATGRADDGGPRAARSPPGPSQQQQGLEMRGAPYALVGRLLAAAGAARSPGWAGAAASCGAPEQSLCSWPAQQHQAHQLQTARRLHLAPPFLVGDDFTPAAVTTHRLGRMPAKLAAAEAELADCRACPRDCGVNRLQDKRGMCGVGRKLLVSTVAPHFAEETPLQGWSGSGTVFFSMCNLRCVFCQNHDISQQRAGFELTGAELADWMLKLQDLGGCHNINLVTPEHVAPQLVEAIAAAVERGLALPIVYNTSAYDGLSSLRLMEGLVDIYMPDFKFWSPDSAARLAKARDYPAVARSAIKEMHRQVGDLAFSPDGLAKRGLLLRHLAMPGLAHESRAILEWAARELGRDTFVHVMEQYAPRHLVGRGERRARGWDSYADIDAALPADEVAALRRHARALGLPRPPSPAPPGRDPRSMRPETAALAGLLGRCARASSVDALAAEAAAAEPLRAYFIGLVEDAEARGSPCADLRALLATGVQARLAQAVARALALRAQRLAANEACDSTLFSLSCVLTRSYGIRAVFGAPAAELAAEVERAGVLSPLVAACTAVAVELEAQQQQLLQQDRDVAHDVLCHSVVVAAPLLVASAVGDAWPPRGQLEGPLLPLAQPAARLALAVLRRAGTCLVLACQHGHVSAEARQALLSDPAVQQLLLANLALHAAHLHEAQRGRPAGIGGVGGGSSGSPGDPAVPAAHAALVRVLELDASAVPQGESDAEQVEFSIYAVQLLFKVSPPTSCTAGGASAGASGGSGSPQAGGAGLAAAAAEVALELAALQPAPCLLAAGAVCAGTVLHCLRPASWTGAHGADKAAAAAAAVVRAFLPLARPTAAALLAPDAGSSSGSGQAAAGQGDAWAQSVDAQTAQETLQRCAELLLLSNGPQADAALAAFARQDPSTVCRLLEGTFRSWAAGEVPQVALGTAQAAYVAISRLGPSLAAAPALTTTGGGAGLLLQREVFACLLTALKCAAAGAPLAAAEADPLVNLRALASGCLAAVRTGCAIGDAVARVQPAAVAAAGGQLAYKPPALWAVLAARGLAVLAQVLDKALAARATTGASVSAGADMPGEMVAAAAVMLRSLREAAELLGARLRALGALPADPSRAGLERLLAQQEHLHMAAAELAVQLEGALAEDAAALATAQERGPVLAAQAEELCGAVCAALPLRACCNNPRCAALAGARSELVAVGGRSCVCSGCVKSAAPARFCSRACQAAAWRAHKPVCRTLAAAAAAAAAGAGMAE
ncbi:ASC1-like protein [Scenedesmus sp. PABB004]|nr:ASC1-like protein [Scenedesmus sp. PABB004]